jgi:hypothetical protein
MRTNRREKEHVGVLEDERALAGRLAEMTNIPGQESEDYEPNPGDLWQSLVRDNQAHKPQYSPRRYR